LKQANLLDALDSIFDIFFQDPWQGLKTSNLDADDKLDMVDASKVLVDWEKIENL
jgi:hypothetical protein